MEQEMALSNVTSKDQICAVCNFLELGSEVRGTRVNDSHVLGDWYAEGSVSLGYGKLNSQQYRPPAAVNVGTTCMRLTDRPDY